MNGDNGRCL